VGERIKQRFLRVIDVTPAAIGWKQLDRDLQGSTDRAHAASREE
jgi:hypothetical protein